MSQTPMASANSDDDDQRPVSRTKVPFRLRIKSGTDSRERIVNVFASDPDDAITAAEHQLVYFPQAGDVVTSVRQQRAQ